MMDAAADHRDAMQWQFFVVPTKRLPGGKTISLVRVALLADAVAWIDLELAVENTRRAL
jgi:hypothetical protein